MNNYEISIGDYAIADLKSIYDLIAQSSNNQAKKQVNALLKTIGSLDNLPFRNPIEPNLKDEVEIYRFALYGNYKIIYYIDSQNDTVVVVRIFDTRKNPDKLKSGE